MDIMNRLKEVYNSGCDLAVGDAVINLIGCFGLK